MGFFYRKSASFGQLKVNLSKSSFGYLLLRINSASQTLDFVASSTCHFSKRPLEDLAGRNRRSQRSIGLSSR